MSITETYFAMLLFVLVALIYTVPIKNIVNPLLLFILPTGVAYVLYYFYFQPFWILSQESNFIFVIGEFMFLFGYITQIVFVTCFRKKFLKKIPQANYQQIHFEKNLLVWIFFTIGMVMNIMTIIKLRQVGSGNPNFRDEFINIVSTLPSYVIYGKYISIFAVITLLYSYLLNNLKKYYIIILIFGLSLTYYTANLTQARTDILIVLMPVVILIIMLKMNRSSWFVFVKYGLLGILGIIGLYFSFLIIQIARYGATNSSFFSSENQTFQYIALPLTAFDKWMGIPNLAGVRHGFGLIEPIDKLLNLISVDQHEMFFAPLGQFNVYSYISAPFLAFGKAGVAVVLWIAGFLNKWLFEKAKNNTYYLLFYAIFEVSVALSFYSWQMMSMVNLYALIYIVLLWFSEGGAYESKFSY